MTSKSQVYLSDLAPGYPAVVEAGLENVGFFETFRPGSTVFLKPNFTYPTYRPGVMTSFECVKATTECLIRRGYKVIIGEADSGGYNPFSMDAVFEQMGMKKLALETGARLVNLTFSDSEILKLKVGFRSVSIPMPKLLLHEIDAFITLPVPKIHMNTGVSMSIKNQWGCIQVPTERLKLHPYLPEVLFEISKRLPNNYSIIDGRYGLNRTGPMKGDVVDLNWLLVSNDFVAADRVCCKLMQVDERSIRHLQHFRKQGWWCNFEEISLNEDLERFKREKFYLERKWTDLPGLVCFNSAFLAWLGYHSPLAGFAHWLLYLFREPFYDHDEAKAVRSAQQQNLTKLEK